MKPEQPEEKEPQAQGGYGGVWRRMRRNAAMLLGGRAVFGLVNLAAAAIAVRAVGFEAFGVVILLQAYVRLIGGLLKFQSWATVTKFGAEALAAGRDEDFRRVVGFTIRLDIIGLFVSIGVGLAAAPLIGRWLDWPPEAMALAPWFVLTIPFITSATPTGVLRLFDRFAVLVRQHALNAVLRFIGAAGVYWLGGGLEELIVVWILASFLSGFQLMLAAAGELRRRRLAPRLAARWSELTRGFPRIWRFVIVLNATSLMDTILTHATVLVVGGMLGPVAAGLYGVVRQMTESLTRVSSLLGPIIFPEFAWLEAQGDRRTILRLLVRTLTMAGAGLLVFCLALLLGGEALLTALFGAEAAAASALLIAAGTAAGLMALGFAVEPVMLTIRKEKALLFSAVISTAIFCAALWFFIQWWGLVGAGLALLLRQAIVLVHRLAVLYRTLVLKPARAGLK
ncbi:lipopolysaccharide biosynthesis protein [Pikeienuella sp. HZG-20]|uniref:lipopolysaccharide biosynthesis protein n=1 Tax=Paludibacillus litoralis TaxID=3133267 RepID=UPI0030EDC6A7